MKENKESESKRERVTDRKSRKEIERLTKTKQNKERISKKENDR